MKKTVQKIHQQHFSVDREDDIDNFLIIVEIIDGKPSCSYTVPMHNYKFWNENMPYYVINSN